MQRLSAAKAKMEAALNKATPKSAVASIPVHKISTAHVSAPVVAPAPAPIAAPAPVAQAVISTA